MGAYLCHSLCISCGSLFGFNPELVPSIRARQVEGRLVEDPAAPREAVCRRCIERANPVRVKNGLEPINILPGAYDPVDESEWEPTVQASQLRPKFQLPDIDLDEPEDDAP